MKWLKPLAAQKTSGRRMQMMLTAAFLLGLAAALPGRSVSAQSDCTWDGTNGANWTAAAHWTTCNGGYPGDGANNMTAVIGSGKVFLDADQTITSLTLSGGILDGNSQLTTTDLTWSGGSFVSSGLSVEVSNLAVSGAGARSLTNTTLTVSNSTAWTGGATGPYTLTASSLILAAGSSSVTIPAAFSLDSPSMLIPEQGTLIFSGNLTGAGSVQVGFLSFAPTVTFSGTVNLGATRFQGGSATFSSSANLQKLGDPVTISGGTVVLTSGETLSLPHLALSAGTLSGTDTVNATQFSWIGGNISSSTSTTFHVNVSDLNFTGAGDRSLTRTTLNVSTISAWDGSASGTLYLASSRLALSAGATPAALPTAFNVDGASTLEFDQGTLNLNGAISGAGSIQVGAASPSLEVSFSGPYNLGSSTFLNGTATFLPVSSAQSIGDPVVVNGGTVDLTSGNTVTVGTLQISAGLLEGTDTLGITQLTWSGGNISSTGGLTLNVANLTFSGAGNRSLTQTSLLVTTATAWNAAANGTLSLTGSHLALCAGASPMTIPAGFSLDAGSTLELYQGTLALSGALGGAGSLQIGTASGAPTVTLTGTTNLGSTTFRNGSATFSSPSTVQSLGDPVTINGGTLTLTSAEAHSFAHVRLSAGSLSGTDPLTVNQLNWTGGDISSTGNLPLSVAALSYGSAADRNLTETTLTVTTSAAWDPSANGKLTLTGSHLALSGGGSPVLVPTGFSTDGASTLELDQGTLTLSGAISGAGSLQVGTATGAPTVTLTGVYNLGASTFQNGTTTFDPGGTLLSLGSPVSLSGGTVTLTSGETPTLPNLQISAGRLDGTDTLSATQLTWTGGTIAGSGGLIVSGQLSTTGSASRTLDGRSLRVTGTTSWAATGAFTLANGGRLSMPGGGSFSGSGQTAFSGPGSVSIGPLTVNASSPIDVSGGATLVWNGGDLNGGGTVTVESDGKLDTGSGSGWALNGLTLRVKSAQTTWPGAITLNSAAVLDLQSGANQTFNTLMLAGGTLSGSDGMSANSLTLNSGTFSDAGAVSASAFYWASGELSGAGVMTVSDLTLTTSGTKTLTTRTLTVSGTTHWNSNGTGLITLAHSALNLRATADVPVYASISVSDSDSSLTFNSTNASSFTLHPGVSITGPGPVTVNGASLVAATGQSPFPMGNLTLLAGSLGGSDNLSISSLTWSGGTINGAGGLAVDTLSYLSATPISLDSRTLSVSSEVVWSGTGALTLSSAAALNFNTGTEVSIGDLSLASGNLGGTDDLITGALTWSRGTIGAGVGAPHVQAASLTVNGSGPWTLSECSLSTTGATTWSGTSANPFTLSGSRFTDQGGGSIGRTLVLSNGTIDFEGNAQPLTLDAGLSGSGNVIFGQNAAVSATVGGPYSLTSGSTTLAAGTLAINALPSAPNLGSLTVSGGTLSLNSGQTVTLANLALSNGSLDGGDAVIVTNNLDWSGGTIGGSNTLNVQGSLNVMSDTAKQITTRSLTASGVTTWTGAGMLTLSHSSLTLRAADAPGGVTIGGEILVSTADSFLTFDRGAFALTAPIQGLGTVTFGATGPGAAVDISAEYTTGGSVFHLGSIAFKPLPSGASAPSLGAATISGGSLTLSSGKAVSATSLLISSGLLSGSDNLTLSSSLTWQGGTLSGTANPGYPSLTAGGLIYTSAGAASLDTRSLIVHGPVSWPAGGGTLAINQNATLDFSNGGASDTINGGLSVAGGTLTGTDALSISGALSWTGGTISGSGARPTLQAGSLVFSGAGGWNLINRTLSTSANASWSSAGAGTLSLDNSALTLIGGTATTPSGPITLANGSYLAFDRGSFNLTSGLSGAGTVVFGPAAGATVNFSNGYSYSLSNGSTSTFTNGSVTFSNGGTPIAWGGHVTINGASVQVDADCAMGAGSAIDLQSGALSGAGSISGVQDFNWSGGSLSGAGSLSAANLNFTPASPVTLNSRTLTVNGITTWTGAGMMTVTNNARLEFAGAGPATIGSLTLDGGVLANGITLALGDGKQMNWAAGTVLGTGKLTVPSAAALAFTGSGPRTLDTGELDLLGPANWTGSGSLTLTNHAALNTLSGSVLTLAGSGDLSLLPGGTNPGTFSNAGRLTVQQGAGTARIDVPFASPGELRITSGTLLANGDVDGQSVGALTMTGGALSGTGNITDLASLDWSGGLISASSGTPSLTAAALATSGSGPWQLDQRNLTVTNAAWAGSGTLTVSAATFSLLGPGTFSGTGPTVFSGDGALQVNAGLAQTEAGSALRFQNQARLIWAGGPLTGGTITIDGGGTPGSLSFLNGGPWELNAASLLVNGNATWPASGQVQVTHLGRLELSNATSPTLDSLLVDNATLTGTDPLTLTGSLEWRSGTISAPSGSPAIQAAALAIAAPGPWNLTQRSLSATAITGWDAAASGAFTLTGSHLTLSAGLSPISIPTAFSVDPTSQVELDQGTMNLTGGLSGAGSLQVGAASSSPAVTFSGMYNLGATTFANGQASFTPAGTLQSLGNPVTISGGTATLMSGETLSIPSLAISAGGLTGTDAVSVTDLTWTGGTIAGSAGSPEITVSHLSSSGSGPWTLDGRALRISGATNWAGSGMVNFDHSANLETDGGGTLAGQVIFIGNGVLSLNHTLSSSSGSSLTMQSGSELLWLGGALDQGTAVVQNGASLTFGSGPWLLSGTLRVLGAPTWPAGGLITIGTGGILDSSTGASQTVKQLALTGGALQGSDPLTISTGLDWSAGTVSGSGGLTIPATGTVSLTGSGPRTLDARHLSTAGTLNWTGTGSLHLNNHAVLDNQGQINLLANTALAIDTLTAQAAGEMANTGVVNQESSGTTEIDVTLSGAGTIHVTDGMLTLNPIGAGVLDGPIAVDNGTLNFNSGGITLGSHSVLTGNGEVDFGSIQSAEIDGTYNFGGTTSLNSLFSAPVTFTAQSQPANLGSQVILMGNSVLNLETGRPVSLSSLQLQSGTLGGSDPVTVTGQLTWSGGTLSGNDALNPPATLTLPAGAQFSFIGSTDRALVNRVLNAACPTTWTGTGTLEIQGSAVLNNLGPSGVITIQQPTGSLLMAAATGAPVFVNSGTLILANGPGLNAILGAPTANTGSIILQSGTLNINQDYLQTAGMLKLAGGALLVSNPHTGQTLQIDGGRLEAVGGSLITGNLQNNSAEIDLGDLPRAAGQLHITGNYTQGADGSLTIDLPDAASADLIDVGGTATLNGTLKLVTHYALTNGDQRIVMEYGNVVGSFTNLVGSDLGGGLFLLPDYGNSTALTLKATNTPSNLEIKIDDGVGVVSPGTTVSYQITITNKDTSQAVTNALVIDSIPAGLGSVTWSCQTTSGTCVSQGSGIGQDELHQSLNLNPGGSAIITVTGTVPADASGSITNAARVSYNGITNKATDIDTIQSASQAEIYLPLVVR
jgi:fibronectin-binding autotransporter adhesin